MFLHVCPQKTSGKFYLFLAPHGPIYLSFLSSEPRFPQEIFYHFIDESSDSTAQLKVLSLVCKSWHIRSREHLFRLFSIHERLIIPDESYQERSLRRQFLTQTFDWLLHDRRITDLFKGFYVPPCALDMRKKFGMTVHHHQRESYVPHPWMRQDTFPPNQYHFLVLDGIDLQMRTLPIILQSNTDPGFKKVFLKNLVVFFGHHGSSSSEGPLEYLAAFAPSLETLCISNFHAKEPGQSHVQDNDTPSLGYLRQALQKPLIRDQVCGKSVTLKRFMLHDVEAVPRNRVLEILIFETPYLNFANLEYLAIDSTGIALLVGRSHILRNVKHLSLFDKERSRLSA
ncbi:hypothetical protein GYMLUDRAFT_394885 [Collybiopsis luxurians FD-317 M1]|uniref:Uncharacterized protein n=1 Tax=Collybiopsis luxurians FD-317 M1 TaxID=944289 RepID=A0A0D0BAR5_9AGAR|nr:hypothetical protein GYMLUDRAFT_394885 [Collybiopsis luxurians FD-317 M1]